MRSNILVRLVPVGALLISLLVTQEASAQQVVYVQPAPVQQARVEEGDGARFRGAVGLEAGALVLTGTAGGAAGAIGAIGQVGVQINHNWGVYANPSLDVLFGHAGGFTIGTGVMADYTFDDFPLSVAAGPEATIFAAIGGGNGGAVALGAGALYGVRLRAAYYPVLESRPRRRKGLYIAADVKLESFDGVLFFLSPIASIGYAAF